jgi:hypothetical protein
MSKRANNNVSAVFIEEHRKRMNRERMESLWKHEAMDCLFTEAEGHIEDFYSLWVQPLLASGLSFESALDLLIAGRFLPN